MKDEWIKELKKKKLVSNKDLEYQKTEAKRFIRKVFVTPILNGKQFFTQSEFEANQGKILLFESALRKL